MKTTISGLVTAIAGILSFIAGAPPELQDQIPQMFPEAYRGTIALYLRIVAGFSMLYWAKKTAESPPNQKSPDAPVSEPGTPTV